MIAKSSLASSGTGDCGALLSLVTGEKAGPGGTGWVSGDFHPECQTIHPTREALWRADVFEDFLAWIKEDHARGTDLAIGTPTHTWASPITASGQGWRVTALS